MKLHKKCAIGDVMPCFLEEDRALPPTFFPAGALTQAAAASFEEPMSRHHTNAWACLVTLNLYTVPNLSHIRAIDGPAIDGIVRWF